MNSQDARGVGLVLSGGVQHVLNVVVFQFFECDELVAGRRYVIDGKRTDLRRRCLVIADLFGKVGGIDLGLLAEDHGAFDHVA